MAYGKNKKLTMPRAKKAKREPSEQLTEAAPETVNTGQHAEEGGDACAKQAKKAVVKSPEAVRRLAVARVKKEFKQQWTDALRMYAEARARPRTLGRTGGDAS